MWPARASQSILLIGQRRFECWVSHRSGFRKFGSVELQGEPAREILPELLARSGQSKARWTVVLESAACPLFLLPTGHAAWRGADVRALLRHRVLSTYGERAEEIHRWSLGLDHRPGDNHALGFAVRQRLIEEVTGCLEPRFGRAVSVQPALQWAHLRGMSPRTGWWLWQEQDRAVLVRLRAGRPVALNPSCDLPARWDDVPARVSIENLRHGLEESAEPIVVSGWSRGIQAVHPTSISPAFLEVESPEERDFRSVAA